MVKFYKIFFLWVKSHSEWGSTTIPVVTTIATFTGVTSVSAIQPDTTSDYCNDTTLCLKSRHIACGDTGVNKNYTKF